MRVNADGQFNCSEFGGGRVLPVWTENPQYLCETQSSQQPNWNLNNNTNPPQENDAPDWVKEMFGGNN